MEVALLRAEGHAPPARDHAAHAGLDERRPRPRLRDDRPDAPHPALRRAALAQIGLEDIRRRARHNLRRAELERAAAGGGGDHAGGLLPPLHVALREAPPHRRLQLRGRARERAADRPDALVHRLPLVERAEEALDDVRRVVQLARVVVEPPPHRLRLPRRHPRPRDRLHRRRRLAQPPDAVADPRPLGPIGVELAQEGADRRRGGTPLPAAVVHEPPARRPLEVAERAQEALAQASHRHTARHRLHAHGRLLDSPRGALTLLYAPPDQGALAGKDEQGLGIDAPTADDPCVQPAVLMRDHPLRLRPLLDDEPHPRDGRVLCRRSSCGGSGTLELLRGCGGRRRASRWCCPLPFRAFGATLLLTVAMPTATLFRGC